MRMLRHLSALALLVAGTETAHAQTATPISALPAASTLTGSEIVPVVQGGVTKRTTASAIQQGPSQSANTVFAAPNGSAGAAAFRALVTADIPTGTSGAVIPLLNGNNTFSALQTHSAALSGSLASNTSYLFNPQLVGVISTSDSQASVASAGTNIPATLSVESNWGGSTVNDGRNGLAVGFHMTGATSGTNPYRFYAGMNVLSDSAFNDGGTSGTPQGTLYGGGEVCRLSSGATFWRGCIVNDAEISVETGASVQIKAIYSALEWPADAVAGSLVDAGYWLSAATGAVGLTNGIQIDASGTKFPIISTGNLFRSNGGTVGNGIDISGTTITNWAFKAASGVIETDSVAAATNATTGALRIGGGAGIGGALYAGSVIGSPYKVTTGTAPTNTGSCAINTQSGGNTTGLFQFNGACSSGTVILTFGFTAPNGWACSVYDMTTAGATIRQTNFSATAATITVTSALTADRAIFNCNAF